MFSAFFNTCASVNRLVKTDGKSAYQEIYESIHWHLKPLSDEKQNVGIETYWNLYAFTCSECSDILESDRLIMWETTYSVRGVETHSGIRLSYKRAILTKERPWV